MAMQVVAELTVCIGLVLHFLYVTIVKLAVRGRDLDWGQNEMQEEI